MTSPTGRPTRGAPSGGLLEKQLWVIVPRRMAKIAVIETGGKQHVVTDGSIIVIEKLAESYKKGDTVTFDKVLLVDDGKETKVGAPYLSGTKVAAEFIEEGKKDKVIVLRFREKSRSFRKRGHRQPYAKVKITSIA